MKVSDLEAFAANIKKTDETEKLSEVAYRCATSKIYYAYFHKVDEFLWRYGVSTDEPHSFGHHALHANILIESGRERNNDEKRWLFRLGDGMLRLHDQRTNADYKLADTFSRGTCEMAFKKAKEIEELLANLRSAIERGVDIRALLHAGVNEGVNRSRLAENGSDQDKKRYKHYRSNWRTIRLFDPSL